MPPLLDGNDPSALLLGIVSLARAGRAAGFLWERIHFVLNRLVPRLACASAPSYVFRCQSGWPVGRQVSAAARNRDIVPLSQSRTPGLLDCRLPVNSSSWHARGCQGAGPQQRAGAGASCQFTLFSRVSRLFLGSTGRSGDST